MADKWIPNYIKREMNYNPRDILTAQEYNAILNLIIAQGDYNSEWIEYLQNQAIPDAIKEISIEELEEAVTAAVQDVIYALAASVVNKTSRDLNAPMITILNIGQAASGITALNTLLTNKNLTATYAVATNLIGLTSYPTIAQLNTLKNAGNSIVAYSTDASPLTYYDASEKAEAAHEYIQNNSFNTRVFIYPEGVSGNAATSIRLKVHEYFDYAVNIYRNVVVDPSDGYMNPSLMPPVRTDSSVNLGAVKCDSTVTEADLKTIIDNVVQYNKYLVLYVDTDSADYDSELLSTILDYVATKTNMEYPSSIDYAMNIIQDTIGNQLYTYKQQLGYAKLNTNSKDVTYAINELLTKIGTAVLQTTAQNLVGAVNELLGTIGDGTLQTTAQTLIGAINEHESSYNTLNNKVTNEIAPLMPKFTYVAHVDLTDTTYDNHPGLTIYHPNITADSIEIVGYSDPTIEPLDISKDPVNHTFEIIFRPDEGTITVAVSVYNYPI